MVQHRRAPAARGLPPDETWREAGHPGRVYHQRNISGNTFEATELMPAVDALLRESGPPRACSSWS